MKTAKAQNIDDYIAGFPEEIRKRLQEIRITVRQALPEAEEVIAYAIPTFRYHGNLVHFAAFKNHIGLYPAPNGTEAFNKQLAAYVTGKGTVQFPHNKPLPLDLITQIVKNRAADNLRAAKAKSIKKKTKASSDL